MKYIAIFLLIIFGLFYIFKSERNNFQEKINTRLSKIKTKEVRNYSFLEAMYEDDYFPNFLVDKGKLILLNLCLKIENQEPQNLRELYEFTHSAAIDFNKLNQQMYKNRCEIETMGREIIAADFSFIAKAYGFENANVEGLIAPRKW